MQQFIKTKRQTPNCSRLLSLFIAPPIIMSDSFYMSPKSAVSQGNSQPSLVSSNDLSDFSSPERSAGSTSSRSTSRLTRPTSFTMYRYDNKISRRGGILTSPWISMNENANTSAATRRIHPRADPWFTTTTASMTSTASSAFSSHLLPSVSEYHPNHSASNQEDHTIGSTYFSSFLSSRTSPAVPPGYHIRRNDVQGASAPAASIVSNRSYQTAATSSYYYSSSASSNSSQQTTITGHTKPKTRSQRFRDDPEKKSSIKTEMCKFIILNQECEFGSKCNFAHDESELRCKTILERHEQGLIDKETFRTKPCLAHISTGSW
jgi:hypothetical protein